MSSTELEHALGELARITGISLKSEALRCADEEQTIRQLKLLTGAYKEKYNKNYFLESIMLGQTQVEGINEQARRFHLDPTEPRVLYLVEARPEDLETSLTVLRHMLAQPARNYVFRLQNGQIAVVCALSSAADETAVEQLAASIVDTVNMEALANIRVAYSPVLNTLAELRAGYTETALALQVGRLFQFGISVFPYNRMGVGRLIRQLPEDVCRRFLAEIYGDDIPAVQEEEFIMVNTFMSSNLNIAETAKGLHMHRNTLIYRIEAIEKATGLNIRRFEDAMTYKVAMMVRNYLKTKR